MRGRLGKAWDRLRGGDRTRRMGRLSAHERTVRDKKIRKLHSEGRSPGAIAREVGVHEKTVERALKASEKGKPKTVAEVLQRQGVAGVDELFSDPEVRARYAQRLVDKELGVSDSSDSEGESPLELLMVELLEEMRNQDPLDKLFEQGERWEALKQRFSGEGDSVTGIARAVGEVLRGPIGSVVAGQLSAQMSQAGRPPPLSAPAQPGVQAEISAPHSTGAPQGSGEAGAGAVSPFGEESAQGPEPAGVGPTSAPQGLPQPPAWLPLDRLAGLVAMEPEAAAQETLRFAMAEYGGGRGEVLEALDRLAEIPPTAVAIYLVAHGQHPSYGSLIERIFARAGWLDSFLDTLFDGLEGIRAGKDIFAEPRDSQDAAPPAEHESGQGA